MLFLYNFYKLSTVVCIVTNITKICTCPVYRLTPLHRNILLRVERINKSSHHYYHHFKRELRIFSVETTINN